MTRLIISVLLTRSARLPLLGNVHPPRGGRPREAVRRAGAAGGADQPPDHHVQLCDQGIRHERPGDLGRDLSLLRPGGFLGVGINVFSKIRLLYDPC